MTSDTKQKLYEDITNKILLGISPKSLYIFGSYARNQETKDSDIDLLIEMDTDLPLWKRMGPVRRLLLDIRHPFDILVYTPKEMRSRLKDKYSVVYRAVSEGQKLYG